MVPPEHRDAWRMHRLGIGETVADVSKRYGIAMNALVAANNLQSRDASEGDRLVIPAVARPAPVAARRPVKAVTPTHRTTVSTSTSKPKTPAAHNSSQPKSKATPKSPVIAATTKPRTSN